MEFRTQIPISKSSNPIDYNSKMISLGSCFAVNMAEKLDYFKFQNNCNPFGILFHPLAIEKLFDFAVSGKHFTESDIFFTMNVGIVLMYIQIVVIQTKRIY